MSETAASLKHLHELHLQLQSVQEKLERGPRQVRTRRQFVEKKQAEREAQAAQLKQLRMTADQKSLQLKINESKIADLRGRLNAASSNREYDIIRSQIDADTMANSVLEDEILEVLEKVDAAQIAVRRLDAELKTAQAEEQRVTSEVTTAEPGLREQAAALEAALKQAEGALPGTILEGYRRLVHAHGAGALASVENKACTACHAILSPQDNLSVKTGKLVFCRSCGRLLYPPEAE